jgi:hypothetical protein
MGSIRLRINVGDIAGVITSYNVIRIKRSLTGESGPYSYITALTNTAAVLISSLEGPFAVQGRTLQLKRDGFPQVDICSHSIK